MFLGVYFFTLEKKMHKRTLISNQTEAHPVTKSKTGPFSVSSTRELEIWLQTKCGLTTVTIAVRLLG